MKTKDQRPKTKDQLPNSENRKPKTENRAPAIGAILLAAGAARRMGAAKLLLRFEGRSLLRRAAETAAASNLRPVVVVLGAGYAAARAELEGLAVETARNDVWESGLGSSLVAGLERLLQLEPELAAVVVALADQPFVEARHLNDLAAKFRATNAPLVAAAYRETVGVPALFAREMFAELRALTGDKGAKVLMEKYRGALTTIPLPEAARDIDTPEDYAELQEAGGI